MPPLRTIASGTCRVGDMWTDRLYRRREAFRLLRTAGAEVKADIGKSQFRQLLEIGVLGLKGYRAADYYQLELYKDVARAKKFMTRSEEHTSELQSLMRISYAVFCLTNKNTQKHTT